MEKESTRSHCVGNSLWNRLWTVVRETAELKNGGSENLRLKHVHRHTSIWNYFLNMLGCSLLDPRYEAKHRT